MSFLKRIYCFFFGHKNQTPQQPAEPEFKTCDYCGYPLDDTHPWNRC